MSRCPMYGTCVNFNFNLSAFRRRLRSLHVPRLPLDSCHGQPLLRRLCIRTQRSKKVIVYDICAFQPLHQLIHSALPLFWSRVDATCAAQCNNPLSICFWFLCVYCRCMLQCECPVSSFEGGPCNVKLMRSGRVGHMQCAVYSQRCLCSMPSLCYDMIVY